MFLGKYSINVSKKCFEEEHVDLLLTGEEVKMHYALIKDFNTFICDNTLHLGKKHFCRYCLQASGTEKVLKRQVKDCFKINGKQRIKILKNWKYVRF